MPFDATPVTSPVIDTLQKTHKTLRKYGWIQDDEYREGSYCLIGAIRFATRSTSLEEECINALKFKGEDDLTNWNDACGRTRRGVLQRITFAIQREKKRLLLGAK